MVRRSLGLCPWPGAGDAWAPVSGGGGRPTPHLCYLGGFDMVCHGVRIGTHGLAPQPEFFPFLSLIFAICEVQLPPRLGLQSPQEEPLLAQGGDSAVQRGIPGLKSSQRSPGLCGCAKTDLTGP